MVTLLSEWAEEPKPAEVTIDPSVDMKTPPKTQVDTASAGAYFAYAAEPLKLHPPHLTDQPMIARTKRIEPGKSFDLSEAEATVQRALKMVPQDATVWPRIPEIVRSAVLNDWKPLISE